VRCQLRRAAEQHATPLGALAALAGALNDQVALELRGMECTAYRRLCGHCGYAESHIGCGMGRGLAH
jgi:hypothetical protein